MFKNEDVEKAIAEGKLVKATPPQQPTAFPPIPTYPAAINQNFVAPLPAGSWQSPDQQRQWQNPSLPQVRISPLPPSASLTAGAAAASQAIQVAATSSGGTPKVSITLTEPPEFIVSGSPVGATGEIDVTWNTVSPGVILQGPINGLVGFDRAFGSFGASLAGGTASVTGTKPTGTPEWALYTDYIQTSTFTPTLPTGWTDILSLSTNAGAFCYQAVPAGGSSASQTFTGTGAWSASMCYFGGPVPSFVQFQTAASSGGNAAATLTGVTAGNAILLIVRTSLNAIPGTSGMSFTVTDSQGLKVFSLAQNAQPGSGTTGAGAQTNVYILPNAGAGTEIINVTGSTGLANWGITAIEITPPLAVAGVPRFQAPQPTDLNNVINTLSVVNGGTSANLHTTGGTSQVLKQTSVGGPITVGQLAASNLSDGTTGTGAVVLANGASLTGKFVQYNSINLIGNGVPAEYATVDLTAQSANIGLTSLYPVPGGGGGMYRISAYVVETLAGTISSTLPNVQIVYTDKDGGGTVTLDVTPVLAGAGLGQTGALTGNTVGLVASGVVGISAASSTMISYQTVNYASSAAGMLYALHIRLEAL